ncbi:MAG: tRNA 2-thiouridine(34) synthase MnmA [Thermoguttaceae bacterium]
MSRVLLAMSGGVDSSVAAWLLREQGHEVIGVFMRHGQSPTASAAACPSAKQGCCTAADADDARRVADMLGVPFYALNFQPEFDRIVDYFVADYAAGRTPNPCIVCNTRLKFGRLFDYADQLGADYVATGHYARIVPIDEEAEGFALCRGLDSTKDQSYVLFGIERSLLGRLMFPVGDHRKEDIRKIAERLGLRVAAKRDSQEICFVPDQDHARFVRERRGGLDTSGEIVTTDGTVVGRHDGFERFTIGQRKGLRVAFGEPRYVVRIEPESRRVVIGTHEELAREDLTAAGANWLIEGRWEMGDGRATTSAISNATASRGLGTSVPSDRVLSSAVLPTPLSTLPSPPATLPCSVKIRYRSAAVDATVELLPGDRFRVRFVQPCYGIAPGQAAVCYQGDRVLGGGWIEGP